PEVVLPVDDHAVGTHQPVILHETLDLARLVVGLDLEPAHLAGSGVHCVDEPLGVHCHTVHRVGPDAYSGVGIHRGVILRKDLRLSPLRSYMVEDVTVSSTNPEMSRTVERETVGSLRAGGELRNVLGGAEVRRANP